MSKIFFIVSAIISTFSSLLPLAIYWRTRRLQKWFMKYLALILAASFLADFIGIMNSLFLKTQYVNESVSYLYYFIDIIFLSLLYRAQFSKRFENLFTYIIVLLFSVYSYWLFFDSMIVTRHESKVPVGIISLIFCFAYFYQLIKKMPGIYVYRIPMFWINSGLLTYASGTLILFGISNYLIYVLKKDMIEYWIFHNTLNTICHILIAIGLGRVTLEPRIACFLSK